MSNSFVKEFNKDLKKAKTPQQVYATYDKHSEHQLAKYGVIALSYFDNYISDVGNLMRKDKLHQKLNSKGHRSDVMTKKSARELIRLLNLYGNRLLSKLSKGSL